jgi:hypothetical protein
MSLLAVSFVSSRINRAYDLRTANCWHLVAECQKEVYGREVPKFSARTAASRKSRAAAASVVPEGWAETNAPEDGAVVLLSRPGAAPDTHAGTVVRLPNGFFTLHTDDPHGVVIDDDASLAARGWTVRKFFIPTN